jgi:hypothetical protein
VQAGFSAAFWRRLSRCFSDRPRRPIECDLDEFPSRYVAAIHMERVLHKPHFTLSQVALNDTIMVFAFAPIVGLLLGLSAITVPWDTLVLSVVLYIVVPVIVAQFVRRPDAVGLGSAALGVVAFATAALLEHGGSNLLEAR